jgi:hypothetical protein
LLAQCERRDRLSHGFVHDVSCVSSTEVKLLCVV